ncbi:MAG: hypothetical protein SynsKO_18100 [Synoicihabitans sp.]
MVAVDYPVRVGGRWRIGLSTAGAVKRHPYPIGWSQVSAPRVGASLDEARVLLGGISTAGAVKRHPYPIG